MEWNGGASAPISYLRKGPAPYDGKASAALKARKDTGDSVRKIAARFGVDASTVQRISRPFDAAA